MSEVFYSTLELLTERKSQGHKQLKEELIAMRGAAPADAVYQRGLSAFRSAIPAKQQYLARIKNINYLPNVLMTPHKGAATMDGFRNMGRSSAEKIFAALDGKLPTNCLNPEARQVSN